MMNFDFLDPFNQDESFNTHTFISIFDGEAGGEVSQAFNAVAISLNGKISSDLNWQMLLEYAHRCVRKGLKILWEIDLGIGSALPLPLSDEGQYLGIALALDHFAEAVWPQFQEHTLGVVLYRGSLDFSAHFIWGDKERANFTGTARSYEEKSFCRNATLEYLTLLANRLPEGALPCLLLDASSIQEPFLLMQLLAQDAYARFCRALWSPAVSSNHFTYQVYGSLNTTLPEPSQPSPPSVGICIPSSQISIGTTDLFKRVIQQMSTQQIPFRAISETHLNTEWHKVDKLIIDSESLTPQGARMVRGFCAAGGVVVTLQNICEET